MIKLSILNQLFFISIVGACLACGSDGASDGGNVGDLCGGSDLLLCETDLFCNFENFSCGQNASLGTCVKPPELCAEIFMPVCGCDGLNYPNECNALGNGISIAAEGECP